MSSITPAALTINQATEYLAVSRAQIYRLFRSGELKPAKVGGRTLIRRVDADALLSRAIEQPLTVAAAGKGIMA
ncbi:DNA-binding protein [Rhizobium acidisoli]|uniref:DNA-binding protein n=1 Tax=Rhizobium acidisoli TaxID=1538158 RepID=A0AAE5WQQ9_9HYPH|nr:helix-turn-helix domain-containing protein [Rhizobium acidisoli]KPH09097.1 hypothetical protein AOG23_07400 [Rhizobium acidisoli]QAS80192.1 DNA-binding protein [Rhizobium acidisoli]